jgi:hypothetical protein
METKKATQKLSAGGTQASASMPLPVCLSICAAEFLRKLDNKPAACVCSGAAG